MADLSTHHASSVSGHEGSWTATLPTIPGYNYVGNHEYYPGVSEYGPPDIRIHEYNSAFLRVSDHTSRSGTDWGTPISIPRSSALSTPMEYLPLNFSLEIPTLGQYNVTDNDTSQWNNKTSNVDQIAVSLMRDIILGMVLGILCLLTFVGNAMVLHAVRTEKRLQTVSMLLLKYL